MGSEPTATYTVDVTPTVDGSGDGHTVAVVLSLPAAVALDRALNDNTAATDLSFTFGMDSQLLPLRGLGYDK